MHQMPTAQYDVAIVGAGPAGSAAAISLSLHGARVLIVESCEFPRARPGESLHPGVEPILEKLDVAREINAAGFPRHSGFRVSTTMKRQEVIRSYGAEAGAAESWKGFQADRSLLDLILLEKAKRLGVTVWQPCRALNPVCSGSRVEGLLTEAGRVEAGFVLDASGGRHWMARKLKIPIVHRSRPLIARYGYVQVSAPDRFEMPLFSQDLASWTWIARVGAERLAWVHMNFDGADPGPRWAPEQLKHDVNPPVSRGADVTWRISRQLSGEGWFLLGDAAAVTDPSASHGILRGLMSGMYAASIIISSRSGTHGTDLHQRSYDEWLSSWFQADARRLSREYPGIRLRV